MNNKITIEPIAYIKNGYKEKFGVPRQSGLAEDVKSKIVFCTPYNDEVAFRGIEEYSHLWLVWGFSENTGEWSPTVRPPRLGGNTRVGVFATRSPFRPNSLGLSCVKLEEVKKTSEGITLVVSGADLKNDTPIYDVKPYLPYVDCIEGARGSFSEKHKNDNVDVVVLSEVSDGLNTEFIEEIKSILSLDPRPGYSNDTEKIYGFAYKEYNIKFRFDGSSIIVVGIEEA